MLKNKLDKNEVKKLVIVVASCHKFKLFSEVKKHLDINSNPQSLFKNNNYSKKNLVLLNKIIKNRKLLPRFLFSQEEHIEILLSHIERIKKEVCDVEVMITTEDDYGEQGVIPGRIKTIIVFHSWFTSCDNHFGECVSCHKAAKVL